MASVYLGLAPGGVVQVWVRDSCNHPVKVARAQAEIEPLGPSHWGRAKAKTKGDTLIRSVKNPSAISRNSAFHTEVGSRDTYLNGHFSDESNDCSAGCFADVGLPNRRP